MHRLVTLVVLAGLMVSPLTVLADDLNPPPWRGQPGTTFGEWNFSTPDTHPVPDIGVYPYGPPSTTVTPGLFQQWMPTWGGRDGVWPLSGEINVTIPNRPEPLPYKDIWIQLTWAQQAPNVWPAVSETRFGVPSTVIHEIPLPNGWFNTTYLIHLEPNPNWENILITGAVNVDQMVIDTICIPEPATLILMLSGLIALVIRKK